MYGETFSQPNADSQFRMEYFNVADVVNNNCTWRPVNQMLEI
jgi:trehalose utilization protein